MSLFFLYLFYSTDFTVFTIFTDFSFFTFTILSCLFLFIYIASDVNNIFTILFFSSHLHPFLLYAKHQQNTNQEKSQRIKPHKKTAKNKNLHSCFSQFFKGANQNRTGDRGVADLCLTAWLWRLTQYSSPDCPRESF